MPCGQWSCSGTTATVFEYDEAGRLARGGREGREFSWAYTYPDVGSVRQSNSDGESAVVFRDQDGRELRRVDALGGSWIYAYNSDGRQSRMTDPRGNAWGYAYDAQGNLRQVVDPKGNSTIRTYTPDLARLDDLVDSRGNRSNFSHDAAGNLVEILRANGTSSSNTYTPMGDAVSATNRRGQVVTRVRDEQGRVTLRTYPDGHTAEYEYDARGRLVRAVDSETGAVALEYEDTDALAKVTYPGGRWLRFESNAAGLRTASFTSDGYELHYAYNAEPPAGVVDGWQRRRIGALRVRPPRQARPPHARKRLHRGVLL